MRPRRGVGRSRGNSGCPSFAGPLPWSAGTVLQVDPIWMLFNVSDNEQLRLNKAMADGRLTLPRKHAYEIAVKLSDGSTFPHSGRINFADSRVNPQTGTYEMRAESGLASLPSRSPNRQESGDVWPRSGAAGFRACLPLWVARGWSGCARCRSCCRWHCAHACAVAPSGRRRRGRWRCR